MLEAGPRGWSWKGAKWKEVRRKTKLGEVRTEMKLRVREAAGTM